MEDLTAMGVPALTRVKHVSGVDEFNRNYLKAKRDWGHGLDDTDLS